VGTINYRHYMNKTTQARVKATSCPCNTSDPIPGWLIDVIADEKLKAGWNTKRSNMCPTHFVAKTTSGVCPFCEE
jgi:hypothetical protein